MEETLINRTMPNSREAEQSVIGSMIMDKDAILTAMEMLISEDFYYKQYGILFDTMIELYSKGLPVDLVTLQNKLKEKRCAGRDCKFRVCKGSVKCSPNLGKCKILCTDRKRQFHAAQAHQIK